MFAKLYSSHLGYSSVRFSETTKYKCVTISLGEVI